MKNRRNKLTQAQRDELRAFDALTDDEIDTSDIPESRDWAGVRGLFHMPREEREKAIAEMRRRRPKVAPSGDWTKYEWTPTTGYVGRYITKETQKTLDAYRSQPNLVAEHANHEEDTARGGYARRQLFELVQNSADALADSDGGRIVIELSKEYLYCADEGKPIDNEGVRALMFSHLSPKRGTDEIGRFGLGFKSVLGVTDKPEFFSRSGSFRFDRERAANLVRSIAPDAERYPVLRLPEAIDPDSEMESDPVLRKLMEWSSNVVRLPLKEGAYDSLCKQIEEFPPEFLLFVEHVSRLQFQVRREIDYTFKLTRNETGLYTLYNGDEKSRWMVVKGIHKLSPEAKADSRSLDDTGEAPISWAAPIDRLNDPGKFWAFFPTMTTSLLAGILNAPWKTNEDRQNLLEGPYNDELIEAAAGMVAGALSKLSTQESPAQHLDALPRRHESGDNYHSDCLRNGLLSILSSCSIAPDQKGALRRTVEISYPPDGLNREALERWAQYDNRPQGWLHHNALTRNRIARLESVGIAARNADSLPRATIAEWLEALTRMTESEQDRVRASMAAIQTAALIPESIREGKHLGKIVLTSSERWTDLEPDSVFLGDGDGDTYISGKMVHSELQKDPDTLSALRQLGIKPASPEIAFEEAISAWSLWQTDWVSGYVSSREYKKIPWDIFTKLDPNTIRKGLESFSAHNDISGLRILYSLINDGYVTRPGYEVWMDRYWNMFWPFSRDIDPHTAAKIIQESKYDWRNILKVKTVDGNWQPLFDTLLPGPIVPEDGNKDSHVTIDIRFHQDSLALLEELGAVDSPRSGHKLSESHCRVLLSQCRNEFRQQEGLTSTPRYDMLNFVKPATSSGPLDVLEFLSDDAKVKYTWRLLDLHDTYEPWIMKHDTQIKYSDMTVESPALKVLREHGRIRTEEGIRKLSDGLGDAPASTAVRQKLLSHPQSHLIRKAFDISVGESEEDEDDYTVPTDAEITRAREEVRKWSRDEFRLLEAVGESNLRLRLPQGLIEILKLENGGPLNGVQVARAAIATYHTGALREYRDSLGHLGPPRRWAGSPSAVAFVKSLGFSEEWAMERNSRRDPYIEVEGPFSLPRLHPYQRKVVDNARSLIRSNGVPSGRRGMISMPTGSGKTRVAVQSIVEAMREGEFEGGILWVADRDELCEQAVGAWQEVWASEGIQRKQLRISRMWGGQPVPLPTAQMHVIVATIQTLSAKINNQPDKYEFLSDFKLLVFDEAHRSVAPTFTSVMEELGLTRWRRTDEPLLIGLTATPYRGRDEDETRRLVNRYGQNRLDSGAFKSDDPEKVITELQDMQVLARASHGIIEGGSFSLSSNEMRLARDVPWLPQSVENRIADNVERTKRIVEAYRNKVAPDAPTLIFATSVEHSQTLAALLTSRGVSARAVSANTDRYVRRRIVEEFRNGEIKVLVNYGIFREGFDAPKTRAIIVARPVYSPNLYFQMIGRGLRGVMNGGNDRCLILNVQDNIENFQRNLAFTELDWLWDDA